MRNTLYRELSDARPSRSQQLQRIQTVIRRELTPAQRETLLAYHIQGKCITQIAQERGVHRSTVSRTLKRAERRLQRYLTY